MITQNEIKALSNNVRNLIKRARITLVSTDDALYQRAQVTYLEKTKVIETISPYGLAANAPVGSLAIIFNVNGAEANCAGIPYNPYTRKKNLKSGEVVVYNPVTGSEVYFKQNGDIEIEGTATININSADEVNINGDTEPLVKGNALKTLYNAHTHTSAAPGSPTTVPVVPMSSTQLSQKNFTG